MGGAVSSGESNDDLIDNLKDADYIKTPLVEDVFRAVDRAFYYTKPHKKSAYKDVAWKDHNLHLSAPCIYSEVMESLQLKDGMSFLNVGSGTGYLSTMAGLILGRNGVNHGIEVHPEVVDYARSRLNAFVTSQAAVDLYEFCEPRFVVGNCMDISKSTPNRYDRIYCGAACPESDLQVITDLLKIGGICIVPVNDSLMLIQRTSETEIEKKSLLPVSFATLVTPPEYSDLQQTNNVSLPEWTPSTLSELCRSEVRQILRKSLVSVPKKSEDGAARKRKKKVHDRRRANRLLVVQRRRNSRTVEGRENGFVAIAYSMGENSSEDDGSQVQAQQQQQIADVAAPASSKAMDLSSLNDVTECEEKTEKVEVNHSQDSGTESGLENGVQHSDEKPEENRSQVESSMEVASTSTESDQASSANAALPATSAASASSATIVENRHVLANGNGVLTNGPLTTAASRLNSTTRVRTPTTESILNRIREIIHTRQMEREALRTAGERILEQVDQALREPAEEDEFQDAVNDDDEIDHECVWTSTEESTSSSSSSSSSEDDSDDYQYAEPIIIGRRHRRSNDNVALGLNTLGVAVTVNSNRPVNSISESGSARKISSGLTDPGVHGPAEAEETVVFHPVSLEMASKINELPLPPPLKRYLNYQRDL